MILALSIMVETAAKFQLQCIEENERSFRPKIVHGHIRVIGEDGCTSSSSDRCAVRVCLSWHNEDVILALPLVYEIVENTGHNKRCRRQLVRIPRSGKSLLPYRGFQCRST